MAFRKIIKDSEGGQKYVTEQEEELVFDQVPTQGSFNPVTSDGVANALSVGLRKDFHKQLSTAITSFRTGDVIPVDGPSGTAKMSKDALLQLTKENVLDSTEFVDVETSVMGSPVYDSTSSTKKISYHVDAFKCVVVDVKNTYSLDGYYSVNAYDGNDNLVYSSSSILISAGSSHKFTYKFLVDIEYIELVNTNNRSTKFSVRGQSATDIAGDKSGEDYIVYEADSRQNVSGPVNFKKNSKVTITINNKSSSNGYFYIQLYPTQGSAAAFSTKSQLIAANSSFTIDVVLPVDISYFEFVNTNDKISSVKFVEEKVFGQGNPCEIADLNTASSSQTNATVSKDWDRWVFTPSSINSISKTDISTRLHVDNGDFVFIRIDISVTKDCFFGISLNSQLNDGFVYSFGMKGGTKRTLYMRSGNFSTDNNFHFYFQITAENNNDSEQIVTIEKLIVAKNGYSVWRNATERAELKEFRNDKLDYIVSANGDGHFVSITQGLIYLGYLLGDGLREIPTTLFIRNGIYDMEQSPNVQPISNAAVYKKDNKVSLIGEDRDHTIVRFVNTSTVRVKVIDIALSECTIANMTVESLHDSTYVDSSAGGHQNCYCIHMDNLGGPAHTKKYTTTLKNLKLISTCSSPLGAGAGQYQDIVIDNCIFESRSDIGRSSGACYIHGIASGDGTMDNTISLSIRDCDFRSFDGTNAITLPSVGTSSFANIQTTINNMRVYSNGTPVNASVTGANLQPECSGNNVSALNLSEY